MTYILQALGPEDAAEFCRILHRLPGILAQFNEPSKGDL